MPVTHHVEDFRFPVKSEPIHENPDDLHVEFNIENVKTSDKGPFKSAKTDGNVINLKMQAPKVLEAGKSAKVEFEADGEYSIKYWWWTVNGEIVGDEHEGPPKSLV